MRVPYTHAIIATMHERPHNEAPSNNPGEQQTHLSRRDFIARTGAAGLSAVSLGLGARDIFQLLTPDAHAAEHEGHAAFRIEDPKPETNHVAETTAVDTLEQDQAVVGRTLIEQIAEQNKLTLTPETMTQLTQSWYELYTPEGIEHDNLLKARERFAPWSEYILDRFTSEAVPTDHALLAFAESHFTIDALNKNTGAAGPYQFMKGMALDEDIGLMVRDGIDERHDPILSGHAAAKLLRDNFERMNEDWDLAISAYNGGFVWRYMRELDRTEKPSYAGFLSYMEQRMNAIIDEYAICIDLEHTIPIARGDTLSHISERVGIKQETLMEWNDLRTPTDLVAGERLRLTPSTKHHTPRAGMRKLAGFQQNINYPAKHYGILRANAQLPEPGARPLNFSTRRTSAPTQHTVAPNETPWHIAQKYGMNPRTILAANNIGMREIIHPGDTLTIPHSTSLSSIATQLSLPLSILATLNPSIRNHTAPLPAQYEIRAPASNT